MTHFTERNLFQKAVYWGNPQNDGFGGFSYDAPIEIDCRWVDKQSSIISGDGSQKTVNSSVQVKQDLDVDGMLLLSLLDDIDSSSLAKPEDLGASRILAFDKVPTIKANYFVRKAYL